MLTRRGLIGGLGLLIAAPAVVRAASLMPVRRAPLVAALDDSFLGNTYLAGEWARGDVVTNPYSWVSWVCVESGMPGVWVERPIPFKIVN